MQILTKLFGDETSKFLKRARKIVAVINEREPALEALSDEELRGQTAILKKRLSDGETLDDILPDAFAAVRESAKRTLDQRHYDVQLLAGIALHEGIIAEMKTGEGKTLASTTAVYLNALSEKGVHVVTVNDYLSRRDTVWMGQIYAALGLSVACINHQSAFAYDAEYRDEESDEERDELGSFKVVHEYLRPISRKEAYQADITYGTNNEFGFDYLRDNIAQSPAQVVQRTDGEGGWNFVIIDEVDSILIDEARTPLIISRPDEESGKLYQRFARIVPQLKAEDDYTTDEKMRAVSLTQDGISKVEQILGMENLYDEGGVKFVHHLEQALKAHALFKRDQDYIVKDNEVVIVDQFTGRMMPGRRFSEGLHQAIEAKEGVPVQRESRTVATVTFQNYFRKYDKLAGMTGTAITSAEEFLKVYGREVVEIPTHRPLVRDDRADKVFATEAGKMKALAREVKALHEQGQPVLIGTVSIEKNEQVGEVLKRTGVPFTMLNAKQHEKEASVVAQAGRKGAVTVATNMAGRGVDIVLGGNPPDEARAKEVRELGGLFVIGTERHEARRIDDQLRGRAGRQGDPGASQFFVSLEDDLMRVFGGDKIQGVMQRLNIPEDEPIQSGMVSNAIESAQERIEGHHFDARRYVLGYDEVVDKHRETIYALRRTLIDPDAPDENRAEILRMIREEVEALVAAHTSEYGDIDYDEIAEGMRRIIPFEDRSFAALKSQMQSKSTKEDMTAFLIAQAEKAYDAREEQVGAEQMRALERAVLLRVIDELWVDHLESLDYLKTAIRLQAIGQRDPLVEFKKEGHRAFRDLQGAIQSNVVQMIYRVGAVQKERTAQEDLQYAGPDKRAREQSALAGVAGAQEGANQPSQPTQGPGKAQKKIGRNEKVIITNGTKKRTMKYKKAEPLLESGTWRLVEVKEKK